MISPRYRAYLILLLAFFFWGISGPIIKYTLDGFPPLIFLTYRFGISALLAIFIFLIFKPKVPKLNFQDKLYLVTYAFFNSTLALGLLFFGVDRTTVLDATLISAIAPLLIALAGVFYLKEHVTKREKIGMGIAFLGTFITVLEPILRNGNGLVGVSGNLLILAYLLVLIVPSVMNKRLLRKGVSPFALSNYMFIVGFVTILPVTVFLYSPTSIMSSVINIPFNYHLGVFYMAVISGNIAYALWSRGQRTIEIGEAAVFSYLYPIFAAPLAIFWLKETVTLPFFLGAIFITTGVIVAEYKKSKLKKLKT